MKRLTLFFLCLCISIGWAVAQNRTVKGTVISSVDNLPVIGANVVVVGQEAIGTTTDIDGNFDLSVPANAKQLQFSFTGLATMKVNIQSVMKVTLGADQHQLDQVVVIGYGTGQKLSTVSGSVARVTSEKLQEKPVANVMDALQGQVAGMQVQTTSGDPNAVASVQIHGSGSLGAGTTPLYIVDGVQTDPGAIAAMNQNDFESVTVLKDASSTAIYGARAANGVVYITTKRGKSGEKAVIQANAMFGISQLISRGLADHMMTGAQLLKYQADENEISVDKLRQIMEKRGQVVHDKDFDWTNYFIGQNAPTVSGDLSIRGASDRTNYYISGGYFDQQGIARETSRFSRYTARVNLESRVKDWMKVGVNITGAYTKSQQNSFEGKAYWNSGPFGALILPPYYSPYGEDGKVIMDREIITWLGRMVTPDFRNKYNQRHGSDYVTNSSAFAQFTPLKGLTLKTLVGLDMFISRETNRNYPSNPVGKGLGSVSETYQRNNKFTVSNTAEYKWDINDKNNLTFLLGQEYIDASGESIWAAANGLQDDNYTTLGNGQLGKFLVRPDYTANGYAFNSYFGRMNYAFDRFWYLDASVRNDGSSRFGANKRYGWFYSVGTMFDFHNKFMPENEKLSSLQLKASYGTTGNSEISNYGSLALMSSINYTPELGMLVASAGNPDISWETQAKLNVGALVGFLRDRITLDAAFYLRKTSDMLLDVPMPYSTGFASRWENVGSMQNMGVDLTLNARIVNTKDWTFDFMTTFNYNAEKITKLFYGLDEYSIPNTNTVWQVGRPNAFYLAHYLGVDENDGMQMWYDPKTGASTKTYFDVALQRPTDHYVTPPVSGGFSFVLNWVKAGLSLGTDFSYVLGQYTINNDRFFTENNGGGFWVANKSEKLLNEWRTEGNITDIPKRGEEIQFDDRLLENASFLRLKNIQLAYMIPKSVFGEKAVLTGLKVYVAARNLLTVTKYTGQDPEAVSNVSMNRYPNTRQFTAGVQLMF